MRGPRRVRKPGRGRIPGNWAYRRRRNEAFRLENLSQSDGAGSGPRPPLNRGWLSGKLPRMDQLPPPLAFFLLLFSGWVNRHQSAVIDYLLEENRVLRAVNGSRRLRLTDDQRRRLAVKGQILGRRRLAAVAGIVTPDTILRWRAR